MQRIFYAFMVVAFGAMGTRATTETSEETTPKVLPDSIVVTANRFGLTPEKTVWPTTIISQKEIVNQGSLSAALDGKAGVDVRNYNGIGSVSTLSNWGLFNRHMLLLYNGRAVKDYSLGGFNLSEYSIDEIERIEILKGPQSAFYGSDAVGGVVNLITKSSLVDQVELTTRQGSFNLQHYHLNLTKKVGQFGLGGYAEFTDTDNNRDNAGTERMLFKLQTDYLSRDSRHFVSFATRYFKDSLGVPGPQPNKNYIPIYGNEDASSLFDHQKDENYSVDLQYRFNDDETGTAQLDFFWEKKNLDYNSLYNYQTSYYSVDTTITPLDSQLNIDSVDISTQSVYHKRSSGISGRFMKRLSSVKVAGGIDWLSGSIHASTDNRSTATNIVGPSAPYEYTFGNYDFWYGRQNQFDVWSNIILEPLKPIQLDLSGRIQFIKNRTAQPSYNIGLIYSPISTIRLKLGYGYAFRLPTIAEQFSESMFTAGNDKLNAETSRSIIGSINFTSPDRKISSRATIFYQTVDSLIQYQLDMVTFKYVPQNVEKFKTTGIDLNLNYQLFKNVTFVLDGIIQNAKQTVDIGTSYIVAFYVPDFKWRADISGAYKTFSYNLNLSYTADRSIIQGKSKKKINKVYEIGMTIGLVLYGNIKLSLTGYDLTDNKRPDQFGFSPADNDYPSPGRRFIIGVKYNLF